MKQKLKRLRRLRNRKRKMLTRLRTFLPKPPEKIPVAMMKRHLRSLKKKNMFPKLIVPPKLNLRRSSKRSRLKKLQLSLLNQKSLKKLLLRWIRQTKRNQLLLRKQLIRILKLLMRIRKLKKLMNEGKYTLGNQILHF